MQLALYNTNQFQGFEGRQSIIKLIYKSRNYLNLLLAKRIQEIEYPNNNLLQEKQ